MKKEYNLVSVITSFYNDGAYIRECVESVANSDYPNVEHIIIDDGSTDESSLEVLRQIESECPVRVVHIENSGVCVARNRAIEASSGRYILPLDADDMISESYISQAVAKLDSDDSIRLVVTPYRCFGVKDQITYPEPFTMERLLGHNLWVNCSMYRRADYDLKGGYADYMKRGLEDWEFWIRLVKDGGEVCYLDTINFFYRIKTRGASRNSSISLDECFELSRNIWANNRDAFANYYPDPRCNFGYMSLMAQLNSACKEIESLRRAMGVKAPRQKGALSRLWKRAKGVYRKKDRR